MPNQLLPNIRALRTGLAVPSGIGSAEAMTSNGAAGVPFSAASGGRSLRGDDRGAGSLRPTAAANK